uniref:H/ACA ribonucleoprotein complex subunit n=1 Tax=Steinernema glaseri TaxID=37863 RepID=A0A1I7Z8G6_9BILA
MAIKTEAAAESMATDTDSESFEITTNEEMLQHMAMLDKGVDDRYKVIDTALDQKIMEQNFRKVAEKLGEQMANGCTISFDGKKAFVKPVNSNDDDDGGDSDPEIENIVNLGPKDCVPNGKCVKIEREYDNLKESEVPAPLIKKEVAEDVTMFPFGVVKDVVHRQITITTLTSFANQAALNFDTVVYDKDKQPIGTIDDILGPVEDPIYAVRFKTEEEAQCYVPNTVVFCVPDPTSYVLVHDLINHEAADDGEGGDDSADEVDRDGAAKKSRKRKL